MLYWNCLDEWMAGYFYIQASPQLHTCCGYKPAVALGTKVSGSTHLGNDGKSDSGLVPFKEFAP